MRQPETSPEAVSRSSDLSSLVGPSGARGTILVVEDAAFVRDVTCEILEYAGYRVLKARDAMEAKALFDQNQAVVQLLLADVVLPGESGRDLAAELRTALPTIRVILISGYPTIPMTHSGVVADGVFYLPKPFSAESLLRKIRKVLHHAPHRLPV